MDDNLKLVLEYFDEIRQGDFCIQIEKIVNSTIHTMGLYYALFKKGIITRDEWNEGISEIDFDGVSPNGKAQHFDCCICWFESSYPSRHYASRTV